MHNIFMIFTKVRGWYVGKTKMKDWKAALRGWHSRNKKDDTGYDSNKKYEGSENFFDD